LILNFVVFQTYLSAQSGCEYITAKPHKGDSIKELLERYDLEANQFYRDIFIRINKEKLSGDNSLFLGKQYYLPICKYKYNGKSIRSTIGIDNFDIAKIIEMFNERMLASGIQSKHFRYSKELWVPLEYISDLEDVKIPQGGEYAYEIFGKDYEGVEIIDKVLDGYVFYVVSGHGGPDPGAVSTINGSTVCEDEFAYDVALRLGRNLLEHSARVYIIVRDPNDGIRDESILECDRDEFYLGGDSIDVDQVTRLSQRAEIVNRLYEDNRATAKAQKAIMLHVDSRFPDKRIDVFFYHHENSSSGKATAEEIYDTFRNKYDLNQPGRGYLGSVSSRSLFMLRNTLPVAVYIELGNIQNERDQIRFTKVNNRQALANWLCEALIKAKDK